MSGALRKAVLASFDAAVRRAEHTGHISYVTSTCLGFILSAAPSVTAARAELRAIEAILTALEKEEAAERSKAS